MQIAGMAMSIGIALDPSGNAQKAFDKELTKTMSDTIQPAPERPNVSQTRPMFSTVKREDVKPMQYGPQSQKHKWAVRGVRATPSAASDAALKRMQEGG